MYVYIYLIRFQIILHNIVVFLTTFKDLHKLRQGNLMFWSHLLYLNFMHLKDQIPRTFSVETNTIINLLSFRSY